MKFRFEKAPGLVGNHVKYANVDPDARSQNIKSALELLQYAELMARASRLAAELWLDDNLLLVNLGATTEQFVGQELLAYEATTEAPQLYFWCREKNLGPGVWISQQPLKRQLAN